jgi:hypothetical protein
MWRNLNDASPLGHCIEHGGFPDWLASDFYTQ